MARSPVPGSGLLTERSCPDGFSAAPAGMAIVKPLASANAKMDETILAFNLTPQISYEGFKLT